MRLRPVWKTLATTTGGQPGWARGGLVGCGAAGCAGGEGGIFGWSLARRCGAAIDEVAATSRLES
jgi:hypothetical protein